MLANLNKSQREAVENTDGPVLVLAGAGTGKTTVITNRIAYILSKNLAKLEEILAVTFTNKAANELKERVEKLTGFPSSYDSWIGTFHFVCLKILKMHYALVGLKQGFGIADMSDQKRVIKKVLEGMNLTEKSAPIKIITYNISKLKDQCVDCHDTFEIAKYNQGDIDMTKIYPGYQAMLRESNMVDFDDILMLVIELFRKNNEILKFFQDKFRYVLVDEYQDTNKTQYNLISMLVKPHQNICCVGDDDQSIYSWRGADVTNILNFQKHFQNAKVITLQNNYRSSQEILDVANDIIAKNSKRYEKRLISDFGDGRSVNVITVYDDKQESDEIVSIIRKLIYDGDVNYRKDIAILVRTSSLMRSIEEAFVKNYVPYKIIGGVKFYDKKEIKDAMAYIKLIISDVDVLSLERVINVPKRGIGDKTFEGIEKFSRINGISILAAVKAMIGEGLFSAKIAQLLGEMVKFIEKARADLGSDSISIAHICITLLEDVGYMEMMREEAKSDPSFEKKIDNVDDLVNNLSRFASLQEFFDHMALISDSDGIDDADVVNVMTIHAAKGLEFDAVILPGWEEEIFPNRRVVEENGMRGIEEERRLAYVATTRAKRNLFILNANMRFFFGKFIPCVKSRFIDDISQEFYQKIDKTSKYGLQRDGFRKNAGNYGENGGFSRQNSEVRRLNPDDFKAQFSHKPAGKSPVNSAENTINSPKKASISAGSNVLHERYGRGVILKILGKFAEVKFESLNMILNISDLKIE